MSLAGISSTNYFAQQQALQNNQQQFLQEFQQLGQDLQSGNLSAARSDFTTLQQGTSTSSASSSNPIVQAFNQLGQDLQSGNTTAAQQDFTQLQTDLQNAAQSASQNASETTGHRRHPHRDSDSSSNSSNSEISQLFQQLGQDLQSNNLAGAQQAYNSLLQDFQSATTNSSTAPQLGSTSAISLSA
jgi:outer membrane protein assembly factor BamD (BamD/ComL family)